MQWLRLNTSLYADIPIDNSIIEEYPECDILPGLFENVIVGICDDAYETFQRETAGLDKHPAEEFFADTENLKENDFLLEKMGTSDPNGSQIMGRRLMGSALRNLWGNQKDAPDLVIPHKESKLPEYKNPRLLPGMFPKLFPKGIGGMEIETHKPLIAFQIQVKYLLELKDPLYQEHETFLFVCFDILQHRSTHLNVHLTAKGKGFHGLSHSVQKLTPSLVDSVATHLEQEKPLSDLSGDQKNVMEVLKQLTTTASKIPGSQASKVTPRLCIET